MDEEVAEAAVTSFYNNGLYRTRDETGILIYNIHFRKKDMDPGRPGHQ
jgi:uncharacterized membrane protein